MSDVMNRMSRFVAIVLFVLSAACGGSSPASPAVPSSLDVAGSWTGTWSFVASGVTVTDNVRAVFSGSGAGITGNWTSDSGPTGTMTFSSLPSGTNVPGTFTIQTTTLSGTACSAQASMTGVATGTTMEVTITSIAGTATCVWATDHRFSLKKS